MCGIGNVLGKGILRASCLCLISTGAGCSGGSGGVARDPFEPIIANFSLSSPDACAGVQPPPNVHLRGTFDSVRLSIDLPGFVPVVLTPTRSGGESFIESGTALSGPVSALMHDYDILAEATRGVQHQSLRRRVQMVAGERSFPMSATAGCDSAGALAAEINLPPLPTTNRMRTTSVVSSYSRAVGILHEGRSDEIPPFGISRMFTGTTIAGAVVVPSPWLLATAAPVTECVPGADNTFMLAPNSPPPLLLLTVNGQCGIQPEPVSLPTCGAIGQACCRAQSCYGYGVCSAETCVEQTPGVGGGTRCNGLVSTSRTGPRNVGVQEEVSGCDSSFAVLADSQAEAEACVMGPGLHIVPGSPMLTPVSVCVDPSNGTDPDAPYTLGLDSFSPADGLRCMQYTYPFDTVTPGRCTNGR